MSGFIVASLPGRMDEAAMAIKANKVAKDPITFCLKRNSKKR